MAARHGGDIYRNRVQMDFSVNINPLGAPPQVAEALSRAAAQTSVYPDPEGRALKEAFSRSLQVPEEFFLFGNGASELLMALAHALKPRRALIPAPSFSGYGYAVQAAGGEAVYLPLSKERGYLPGEEFLEALSEGIDLAFFANPNNPTGRLADKGYVKRLLSRCLKKQIPLVLDECFVEFCGPEASLLEDLESYGNLLLLRACTKTYAIPGVRLGYLLCSDAALRERIGRQLPEWNLSVFAQAAGVACAGQQAYLKRTAEYVQAQRAYLAQGLEGLGFQVCDSQAPFVLFYSGRPLYEKLLEQGILIRDCADFKGLSRGYYRAAVKTGRENEALLEALAAIGADP